MSVSQRGIGWIPFSLRIPSLTLFVFLDLALICCLIALCVRSSKNDGFATIGEQDVISLGINWNLGLLWTSLPVLVFRLLGSHWEWITSPISERQPYVDLHKDGGAPASKSILLDYLSVPILWRWCTAFKNKHFLVGTCSLLALIMSIFISSLSARLFAVRIVPIGTAVPVLFNTTFNASAIDSEIDWIPIFDTVSAINVYNGKPLPWTDREYAFQPYFVQGSVGADSNVTASTKAYSAYLNCSIISDSDIQLEFKDPKLSMTASDRGCDIDQNFDVTELQKLYFKTSSEISCSAPAWYSRLVFTAATYSSNSPNKVDNVTVLSCITDYRVTNGSLDTTTTPTSSSSPSSPNVGSFRAEGHDDTRPTLWRVFEQSILSPTTFNDQTLWSTSAFGTLVLYKAQQLGGDQYLSSSILEQAIPEIFSSIYLTAVAKHAFVPLTQPETITGEMSQITQRLFTVYWIAYVIIIILVICLCVIPIGIAHVYTNPTILEEQPAGLGAYAALLDKSPLLDHATRSKEGGIRKVAKASANSNWKKSRWGIGTTDEGRLVIESLDEPERRNLDD